MGKNNDAEGVLATIGCLYVIGILAVWATIIFVALHFIGKFW